MDLLTTDTIVPLLRSEGLLLLLIIPSLLVYGFLADRVALQDAGRVRPEGFGRWDVLTAGVVTLFFGSIIAAGSPGSDALPDTKLIIQNALLTEAVFIGIVVGIAFVLRLGGFSWADSLGIRTYPLARAVGLAGLLLLLAYPLIAVALQVWRVLIASVGYLDDSQQDAVRFLSESKSQVSRIVVAVQAVFFAPVQEELIFRGFLYGCAKRYVGPTAALIFTAALFAGIHLHLPSFAGLFALAVCLTLAYEWTGSIFVPMAMHALFNLLSVVALFQ